MGKLKALSIKARRGTRDGSQQSSLRRQVRVARQSAHLFFIMVALIRPWVSLTGWLLVTPVILGSLIRSRCCLHSSLQGYS